MVKGVPLILVVVYVIKYKFSFVDIFAPKSYGITRVSPFTISGFNGCMTVMQRIHNKNTDEMRY